MRKSIKKMVGIRVAATLISVLLFSIVISLNITRIQHSQNSGIEVNNLLDRIEKAEIAHYKWSSNLSNALYAGTEFTGSIDPTTCVLGQWLYGESNTDNEKIVSLRAQLEPLHKELHQSARYALDLFSVDPAQAQMYYQDTIQANLGVLVGLMDEVVNEGTIMSEQSAAEMTQTIKTMRVASLIAFILAVACMISMVLYIIGNVIRPIVHITEKSTQLKEGKLDLQLNYRADNELGELAETIEEALGLINSYVADINRIMGQLSSGNFDVHTSQIFIGDFRSIQESIESFTSTLSTAISKIGSAEHRVSGYAEQLSSGAQSLAQGATEQASSVQELYATLDSLSRNADENVKAASEAQENARLTGEQVAISRDQMENMVKAMKDITEASSEIGKIIATIENIAFQTNILALNAAVEAARAGAAGKGFAVVSGEVRSLASQSDQAAKATKELIENSVLAAEKGSRIVDEVSATLQKTLQLVEQSNESIGTIAQAIQGEAATISQVTQGIGQISVVVQTNSASSEESAAVSSELFSQVKMLREQTSKFNLKKN
ncbi:methyl-accepting chemotaxis protein IV [Clostridiales bacterium]|nr:methyl-accepting chemotaxis protein IV [Clostridiales bacterium]